MEELAEDQLFAEPAIAHQPARKLSRLRKAGTTPKDAPPASPLDATKENAAPNDDKSLPTLVVQPASPASSLRHREADVERENSRVEAAQQASEGAAAVEEGYRDEEDELESYFEREGGEASRGATGDGEDGPSGTHGGSDDEEGSQDWGADVNADTQRILRETACRDRLGGGAAEVEVKPLSSILGKLKQRQQAAIERAVKPHLVTVPCFEEVFAAAEQRSKPPGTVAPPAAIVPAGSHASACAEAAQPEGGEEGGPAAAPEGGEPPAAAPAECQQQQQQQAQHEPGGKAEAEVSQQQAADAGLGGPAAGAGPPAAVPAASAGGEAKEGGVQIEEDEDDDLDIVSQGSGGLVEANIVELPSTGKKAPLARPFTQEVDWTQEVLIEDGYNSEEEEGIGEEEPSAAHTSSQGAEEAGSDEEEERSSDGEQQSSEAASEEVGAAKEEEEEEQGSPAPAAAEEGGEVEGESGADEGAAAPEGPATAESPSLTGSPDQEVEDAEDAGAAAGRRENKEPKRESKLKRVFLDMEAELSEEEEGARASDDEDEDDLDDQGELADLIGSTEKETRRALRKREELHRQWAEQHDAKELQQVLKGLKNGFRRRQRGGFMEDEDDEEGGRRRRARLEDDDEGGDPMALDPTGGVPWFQDAAGSDEDAEDLDLLKRAQHRHALGGSEQEEDEELARPGSGSIPLDEDSQGVLDLLARSASEPQGLALPPRSRFAPAGLMLGSEPQGRSGSGGGTGGPGASRLGRGLSFVGRQPTAQRHGGSMAGVGSKSFIFGREDSNGALPHGDKTQQGGAAEAAGAAGSGPTSFANLRQLTGHASSSGAGGGLSRPSSKAPGTSLVSRLATAPKLGSQGGSSTGSDAANLVYDQLVAGAALGKK